MTTATITKPAGASVPAPSPEAIRGECPDCKAPIVSACYHVDGRGLLIVWECIACDWRKPL
jgi:hypothetical protein